MLPAIYNPIIKQGVPFRRWIIVTDNSKPPVPVPLVGATAKGQIKSADGTTVLADFSFDYTNVLDGKIEWIYENTIALPPTGGRPQLPYEVYITPVSGDRICPVEGMIEVETAHTALGTTP